MDRRSFRTTRLDGVDGAYDRSICVFSTGRIPILTVVPVQFRFKIVSGAPPRLPKVMSMPMFRTSDLSESDVYTVLANARRRETVRHLTTSNGTLTLGTLATEIAAEETGQSPPPQAAYDSVRSSLRQTHLPMLDDLGVVDYDPDTHVIRLRGSAREVGTYMEVITPYGITWGELYRTLGVCSLVFVVASLLDAPLVGAVDPLLWSSVSLGIFAIAISVQLWIHRWYVLRSLRGLEREVN